MDTTNYTSKFFKINHKEVLELHAQKNTNKEISDKVNMTLYMVEKILTYYNLKPNSNMDKVNHQVVIDLYNQTQKIAEVAKILNLEDYMVDKILVANNITKRKVKTDLNPSDVIRDYLECRDVFIVAEKYGVLSISPIVKILKDNNIKRRKHPKVREKKIKSPTFNHIKTGERFGMLTVIEILESRTNSKGISMKMLLCKCDCGNEVERSSATLRKFSIIKSCGCHIQKKKEERRIQIDEIRLINKLEYEKKAEEYRIQREIRDKKRLENLKIKESKSLKNKYTVGYKKDRLTIVKIDDDKNVYVVCECGTEKTLNFTSFHLAKSCGCLQVERSTIHGLSSKKDEHKRKWYDRWKSMVSRCHNPKSKPYKNYGGRGIRVCDRWMEPNGVGCENYFNDIHNILGPQPSPEHSLDRIDNDGMYEITNLRWATDSEQVRNQRRHLNTNNEVFIVK